MDIGQPPISAISGSQSAATVAATAVSSLTEGMMVLHSDKDKFFGQWDLHYGRGGLSRAHANSILTHLYETKYEP